MKQLALFLSLLLVAAGCGRGMARLDKMDRVQAAVFTDARAMAPNPPAGVSPPMRITNPDQLIAIQEFLESQKPNWNALNGTPRPTRFQLELTSSGGPLYTLWIEPGYLAMASGKSLVETRLSTAETAQLLACLGLPPGYLNAAGPAEVTGVPHYGVVDGPRVPPGTRTPNPNGARTVEYNLSEGAAPTGTSDKAIR